MVLLVLLPQGTQEASSVRALVHRMVLMVVMVVMVVVPIPN